MFITRSNIRRSTPRRTLRRWLPAASLGAALAVTTSTSVAAAQSTAVSAGLVRASGTASITVDPDLALVTIQYSAGGRTPAIAGRAAARQANAIRAAIIALGIPADSIPTSAMNNYRWGNWGNRSSIQVRNDMRDTSYVTNDAFVVRIRDLTLVGRVVDTALVEGAQTISNVEFQATNTEAKELEAIRQATLQARARAGAVAQASGLTLGNATELNVNTPPSVLSMATSMSEGLAYARADAGTTVVAPELKVSVTVSGIWELLLERR